MDARLRICDSDCRRRWLNFQPLPDRNRLLSLWLYCRRLSLKNIDWVQPPQTFSLLKPNGYATYDVNNQRDNDLTIRNVKRLNGFKCYSTSCFIFYIPSYFIFINSEYYMWSFRSVININMNDKNRWSSTWTNILK